MRQSIVGAETSLRRYWIRRADDISASPCRSCDIPSPARRYGRDNTRVYDFDRPIADADPDGYYRKTAITGADPWGFLPDKAFTSCSIRQYHSRSSAYAG